MSLIILVCSAFGHTGWLVDGKIIEFFPPFLCHWVEDMYLKGSGITPWVALSLFLLLIVQATFRSGWEVMKKRAITHSLLCLHHLSHWLLAENLFCVTERQRPYCVLSAASSPCGLLGYLRDLKAASVTCCRE